MTSTLNIGVRHVLPIYPLMMLLAGVAGEGSTDGARDVWRGALVAVVAAGVLETARVYPDNLTFFNALVGGPSGGAAYLTDSNLDWGQGSETAEALDGRQSGLTHQPGVLRHGPLRFTTASSARSCQAPLRMAAAPACSCPATWPSATQS
jgi:hypothetical protein